jgi:regulator of nonsense transcripts 2
LLILSLFTKLLQHLDERSQALINSAFYTVKPPANGPKKKAKVYPPLEGYLRHLLMVRLEPTEISIAFVSKQLIRCPWNDPSKQCGALIVKIMLKTCRKGRYKAISAVAAVAAKLRRHKPEVCIRLLDAVLEELQWSMENPAFKDQQRTITYARLLGELYGSSLASGQLAVQQLYKFIDFGHEIPEALREASEKHVTASDSTAGQAPAPNHASGVSHVIQEDEEMEESPLEPKVEEEKEAEPVAVSRHSKYDPRVPTTLDLPNSAFRVKLVCTLLEVVGKTIVTRNNIPKIEGFLAAFQRYLFTKTLLPTDVEFALLDTFDLIDSQWRKITKELGGKTKKEDSVEKGLGFPRYSTWLEAHNTTVALEEAEASYDTRARARLDALAGESKTMDGEDTLGSDIMDELMDGDDDSTDDPLSVSARDSLADDHDSVDMETEDDAVEGVADEEEDSQSEGSDEDEESEGSSEEDSDDEEGSEDEFDEQAYMRQLEEEAFERELRRLTMDALEKGKVAARGGKVADTMPSGSQFIKKKQADGPVVESAPMTALGGKQGITFQLLRKGNKGKMEAREIVVPTDTNLAHVATKQDDAAARERDMIKAKVLQYEAESAESQHAGGNVYLEQEKLQVIRNRPLSIDDIDRNFGTTGGNLRPGDKAKPGGQAGRGAAGPGGPTASGGLSSGRGGSSSGRLGPLSARGASSGGGRVAGRGGRGRGSASGRTLV